MTDKEFRHLRRADLIEIIYQLQEDENGLKSQIASLKEQLMAKELKQSEAGSIAEEAMALNQVFEAAQAAADQYVDQVKQMQQETESKVIRMITDAQTKRDEMLADAKHKCDAMIREATLQHDELVDQTQKEIDQKWSEFDNKVKHTVDSYAELKSVMESLQGRH